MKKQLLATALSLLVFFASCSKSDNGDDDGEIVNPVTGVVEVTGDITTATNWTADKIYLLKGNVFVTNNVTLTIAPGTIIKGDRGTKGTLIITRGSKINATGTAEKPIVFTSNIVAGGRDKGDWGGLILLGKALNNQGTSVTIEGISDATDKAKHGGTDNADNSGVLKYVRIEYAGVALGPDNEINGLTFGSVGSGTTVDYVEVYRSGDDAFEWFGGSVNAKHLLAVATWDDDFDTDNGFSGKIQFGIAQRLAGVADVSGSNGFESDNNATGVATTPFTSAVFSNMTILGPVVPAPQPSINASYQHAAQIRRNSQQSIVNSVFVGYTEGVFFDDALPAGGDKASTYFLNGTSVFANNLIGITRSNPIKLTNAALLVDITARLAASANVFTPDLYGAGIYTDAYKYSADQVTGARIGTPNFTLIANSPAATGAAFGGKTEDAFFERVAYKGAFGTTDWTAGWASYDSQTLPYTTPGAVTK
ncbi:hypothetical protein OQY15_08435 [Pedobacter sp. MC2016-15]|uniref:hypothetical protein n=1 Tax=Pedobacter sp. MC2016-15 TaxID=2994473 RepID=UPI00224657EC|nr:hypothetical protein [Pedobacter sp. MC2016-15]MCX2479117.1 hypothetical protein [Pedobacter sp. MC2016-15]